MSKTTVIRTVIWPLLGVLIGSVVGVLLTGGDLDGELLMVIAIVTVGAVMGSLNGARIRESNGGDQRNSRSTDRTP